MRYAAIVRDFLRNPPACFASSSAVGGWTRLLVYASELERGGVIPACVAYDDRAWLSLAQVTATDVAEAVAAGLCEWLGQDLQVLGYDMDGQRKVQAARENGRLGGAPPRRTGHEKSNGKPAPSGVSNPGGGQVGGQEDSPGETQREPLSSPLPSRSYLAFPRTG